MAHQVFLILLQVMVEAGSTVEVVIFILMTAIFERGLSVGRVVAAQPTEEVALLTFLGPAAGDESR